MARGACIGAIPCGMRVAMKLLRSLCLALIVAVHPPVFADTDEAMYRLEATSLPPPDRSDMLTGQRPYIVGPFDRLAVDVFDIPELGAREVQADASGRISLPLVGVVEVLGKTPSEIEDLLEERLRVNHVLDPQVTVNLKETVSQVVTVYGEVKSPGQYPVIGRTTLLTALARAQGTGEFAKLRSVMVYRTVNGQRLAAVYDLRAIKAGKYEDPELFANDLVIVDNSIGRKLFRDVLLAAPLLLLVDRITRR